MTTLDIHVDQIKRSAHSDEAKQKLVDVMTQYWTFMRDMGTPVSISSSVGGKHTKTSAHYTCEAFDANPDKGYTNQYIANVKEFYKRNSDRVQKIFIEFNKGKINDRSTYRCTHVSIRQKVNDKKGVRALDYMANISYEVKEVC